MDASSVKSFAVSVKDFVENILKEVAPEAVAALEANKAALQTELSSLIKDLLKSVNIPGPDAVVRALLLKTIDATISKSIDAAIAKLKAMAANVVDVIPIKSETPVA
jgi:hypothetical protein